MSNSPATCCAADSASQLRAASAITVIGGLKKKGGPTVEAVTSRIRGLEPSLILTGSDLGAPADLANGLASHYGAEWHVLLDRTLGAAPEPAGVHLIASRYVLCCDYFCRLRLLASAQFLAVLDGSLGTLTEFLVAWNWRQRSRKFDDRGRPDATQGTVILIEPSIATSIATTLVERDPVALRYADVLADFASDERPRPSWLAKEEIDSLVAYRPLLP